MYKNIVQKDMNNSNVFINIPWDCIKTRLRRISPHGDVVRVVVLLLDRVGAGDPQHDRGHQVFYGQEQQLAVQCPTTFGRAFLAVFSHVLLLLSSSIHIRFPKISAISFFCQILHKFPPLPFLLAIDACRQGCMHCTVKLRVQYIF